MKIDRYDIAILKELQKNGRISKRDLADTIGLSISPCWVRMRKLEDMGYIQRYEARLDFDRLSRFCYVTTLVRLESHHAEDFRRFEQAIQENSYVVHCEAVIGEVDYIIKIIAIDLDHYQRVMEGLLEGNIGIQMYFSHVRSKPIKDDLCDALERLLVDLSNRE